MASDLNIVIEQANSAILARDFSFAEKILKRALNDIGDESSGDSIRINTLLGKLYIRAGSLEKGLETYKKLNEIHPNSLDILNDLGIIYRRLDKFEESVAILEEAIGLDKSNATTLYNLGNTCKQKGDYEKAIDCFTKVLNRKSDDVLAYNHLGSVYNACGQTQKAIDSYKKGLRVDPNHPFLNFNLASIYKKQKRFSEALVHYKASLKAKPNWKEALTGIAESFVQNNQLQKAIKMYKDIIEKNEGNEDNLTKLAELYEINNEEENAERCYRKALNLNQNFLPAVLSYGKLLKKQKRYFDAYNHLSDSRDDNSKELLLLLSEISLLLEDYAMTKECLNILTSKWGQDFDTLKMKGMLFALMGDQQKAEMIFSEILKRSPSQIKLRVELADLYMHNEKFRQAIDELIKYLNEKPQDINARMKLGNAYEGNSEPEKARLEYKKIIKNDAKNKDALKAIMELDKQDGKSADAVDLANKIVDISASEEDGDNLDSLADSLQLYEDAVSVYGNEEDINKNLDKMGSPEEVLDISSEDVEDIPGLESEQEDEMTLSNDFDMPKDFEDSNELEMPFDDLMELADDDNFDDMKEEDIQDLVSFDEPINDDPSLYKDDTVGSSAGRFRAPAQNEFGPEEEITLENVSAPPRAAAPQKPAPMQFQEQQEDFLSPPPQQEESQPAQPPQEPKAQQENFTKEAPTKDAFAQEDPIRDDFLQDDLSQENLSPKNEPAKPTPNSISEDLNDLDSLADLDLDSIANEATKNKTNNDLSDALNSLSKTAESISRIGDKLSEKMAQLEKKQEENLEKNAALEEFVNETPVQEPVDEEPMLNELPEEIPLVEDLPESFEPEPKPQVEPLDNLDDPEEIFEEGNIEPEEEVAIVDEEPEMELELEPQVEISEDYISKKDELLKSIPRVWKPAKEFETELKRIKKEELLKLFSYLRDLMANLSGEDMKHFLVSSERVQMEYVITKLKGDLGLKKKIIMMNIRSALEKAHDPKNKTDKTLKDTLGYLRIVASQLPDQGFASSCSNRIDKIIESLDSHV